MTTEAQTAQPKAARRPASRSGQIIPRGKNFLVRIYLGRDGQGKRQYSNKTIKTGRKNAEKYLTKALRDKDVGVFVEPGKETVSEPRKMAKNHSKIASF